MPAPNPAPESAASNSPPLRAAGWWSRCPGSAAQGSNPWLGDANVPGFGKWQMFLEPANEAVYAGFGKLSGASLSSKPDKLQASNIQAPVKLQVSSTKACGFLFGAWHLNILWMLELGRLVLFFHVILKVGTIYAVSRGQGSEMGRCRLAGLRGKQYALILKLKP
jgi:hypothetical protein